MEQTACKQCSGTGVVSVRSGPTGLHSIDATVACFCNAGNIIFDRVNDLLEEGTRLYIDDTDKESKK